MECKEIPDFTEYDDLINNLLRGTCIFIGAGVSKLAGYRLWRELAIEMVERFWRRREEIDFKSNELDYSMRENLKKHDNEVEIFEYLFNLHREIFIKEIKNIFYEDQNKTNNEIYNSLSKLDNEKSFFITTNIDMGFQNYLGVLDNSVSIAPDFTSTHQKINYLHGRIDKEKSWILTKSQYNSSYYTGNAPPCMEFIANIFQNYSVIFIGYGLRDNEILEGIIRANKKRHHYWLERSYRNNKDYLRIKATTLKENYNISLIPYFIDKNGDELLHKVLKEIYRVLTHKEGR